MAQGERIRNGLRFGEAIVELTTGAQEKVSMAELLDDGVLKVGKKRLLRDARGRAVGTGEYELTYYASGSWVSISPIARASGADLPR